MPNHHALAPQVTNKEGRPEHQALVRAHSVHRLHYDEIRSIMDYMPIGDWARAARVSSKWYHAAISTKRSHRDRKIIGCKYVMRRPDAAVRGQHRYKFVQFVYSTFAFHRVDELVMGREVWRGEFNGYVQLLTNITTLTCDIDAYTVAWALGLDSGTHSLIRQRYRHPVFPPCLTSASICVHTYEWSGVGAVVLALSRVAPLKSLNLFVPDADDLFGQPSAATWQPLRSLVDLIAVSLNVCSAAHVTLRKSLVGLDNIAIEVANGTLDMDKLMAIEVDIDQLLRDHEFESMMLRKYEEDEKEKEKKEEK